VQRPDLDVAFAAPQTDVQRTLATTWADLLGIDRVGIDDNFFDLGGNSLLSIQCIAALEQHGLQPSRRQALSAPDRARLRLLP
jgi:hypothetical protein